MEFPMKVTVHHFKVYDPANDSWIIPQRKSTMERIESPGIRGLVIPGTAEDVDQMLLDDQGRYDPRHSWAANTLAI
jgi:hypothetical protein